MGSADAVSTAPRAPAKTSLHSQPPPSRHGWWPARLKVRMDAAQPLGDGSRNPRPQPRWSSAGCKGSSCLLEASEPWVQTLGRPPVHLSLRPLLLLLPPSDPTPRWAGDSVHWNFPSGCTFPCSWPRWAHDIEKDVKGDIPPSLPLYSSCC